MSAFEPLTLGYDWEVWALNDRMLPGDGKKIERIADRVNTELAPIEAHREWRHIEVGAGIVREWPDLVERTNRYVDWVRAEFAKADLVFYPVGTCALIEGGAGLHIHVGTTASMSACAGVLNAVVPYIPALIALMANSTVCQWRQGHYKAYRSSGYSWGSGGVYPVADPHLQGRSWGGDVCSQRNNKPTMEVRLSDSSLSPRLVCEYALIVAGLLDWVSNHLDSEPVSFEADRYEEILANRWRAATDGLQATFTVGGREVAAVDMIAEIIDKAGAGMRKLAASERDLTVIPKMLAKRQTQADFQRLYMSRYTDLPAYERAFADVLSVSSAFEDYLDIALTHEQAQCRDHDEALLAQIGKETLAPKLGEFLSLPPAILEHKLHRLKDRGLIDITITPEDGIRCSPVRKKQRAKVGGR